MGPPPPPARLPPPAPGRSPGGRLLARPLGGWHGWHKRRGRCVQPTITPHAAAEVRRHASWRRGRSARGPTRRSAGGRARRRAPQAWQHLVRRLAGLGVWHRLQRGGLEQEGAAAGGHHGAAPGRQYPRAASHVQSQRGLRQAAPQGAHLRVREAPVSHRDAPPRHHLHRLHDGAHRGRRASVAQGRRVLRPGRRGRGSRARPARLPPRGLPSHSRLALLATWKRHRRAAHGHASFPLLPSLGLGGDSDF